MDVVVYSTTTCPYCKMLKDYLTEKKVPFIDKLVDQDDAARDELAGISGGFLGVPFTAIDKGDGTKETVVGFDKSKIEKVLGL